MFKCLAATIALFIAACAPTTGVVQTGTDTYALTRSAGAVATDKSLPLAERAQKHMTPFSKEVESEARAKCASQNTNYEYVSTRISHPAGAEPHYTLNFKCTKEGANHG